MWAADQDSDLSDGFQDAQATTQEKYAEPQVTNPFSVDQTGTAAAAPRKRDYFSSLVSRAGTMIKESAKTIA